MHATTLFRREILNRVNGYRIAWETRRGQDYDLFMRIFAAGGRGININEIHYFYRCFADILPAMPISIVLVNLLYVIRVLKP